MINDDCTGVKKIASFLTTLQYKILFIPKFLIETAFNCYPLLSSWYYMYVHNTQYSIKKKTYWISFKLQNHKKARQLPYNKKKNISPLPSLRGFFFPKLQSCDLKKKCCESSLLFITIFF